MRTVLATLTGPFLVALFSGPLVAAETRPRAVEKSVVIERDVEYGRASERSLKLDILRPLRASKERLPAIVYIHGGGWMQGDKSEVHSVIIPFAASGDYFCVSIGYRLSGDAIWPAQIHDCKAAVRWLRANAKKLKVDPERIGVWGPSAGGHLASMLGTSGGVQELEGSCGSSGHSSRVSCVVSFCGPSDLVKTAEYDRGPPFGPPRDPESPESRLLGGPILERKEAAREASPRTYVSPDAPPFFIVHGTKDSIVPFEQAELLYTDLQKAGAKPVLLKMEGGGHLISGDAVAHRVRAFFDKHLCGQDVTVSDEPIQVGMPRQAQAALEMLTGEWRFEASTLGVTLKGWVSWEWGLEKQCLIGSYSCPNGPIAVSIVGWDPSRKQLTEHRYEWNCMVEDRYRSLSDDEWRGSRIEANEYGAEQKRELKLEIQSRSAMRLIATDPTDPRGPQSDLVVEYLRADE